MQKTNFAPWTMEKFLWTTIQLEKLKNKRERNMGNFVTWSGVKNAQNLLEKSGPKCELTASMKKWPWLSFSVNVTPAAEMPNPCSEITRNHCGSYQLSLSCCGQKDVGLYGLEMFFMWPFGSNNFLGRASCSRLVCNWCSYLFLSVFTCQV